MPSRKKERGRARRAAKKASATSRSSYDQKNTASKSDCDHLDIGTNWKQNDYDLSTNLAAAFELKYYALINSDNEDDLTKSFKLVRDVYKKYRAPFHTSEEMNGKMDEVMIVCGRI
eukprot:scaffold19203_cov53-Cyclotella_meneghiniana.AAC.4